MSTTTPSSHASPTSPVDASGPNNDQYKVVRKRNRVPLSCAPCRVRKLKCDRASPCQNCIKRDDRVSCSYAAAPAPRKRTGPRPQSNEAPDDMQQRINKLEGLVLSLMSSGNDAVPPATARTMSASTRSDSQAPFTPQSEAQPDDEMGSETEEVTKQFGVLHFNNNQSVYIAHSHWATILNEISEVKAYFKEHHNDYQQALDTVASTRKKAGIIRSGPVFLLASGSPPDLRELYTRLPRRNELDLLAEKYFSDYDPTLCILHVPSWKRKYQEFWKNPEKLDAAFLGQLFAICGLAMQSWYKAEDEPYEYKDRSLSLAAMYRSLTQQCLHLVDYGKIDQRTIETLTIHLYAEYQKLGAADVELWCLLRTTISLALRTGIHRDGTNYEGVTPFQTELRRRRWHHLRQLDSLWSFSVGLPSLVKENETDTRLPSNLKDEDFDEDTEVLPASRSKSELTDVSYLIAKAELANIFSRIVSAINCMQTITYEDVVKLSDELTNAYHSTFPALHVSSSEDFLRTSSSRLSMLRLDIATLYHKSICVLHRQYLILARRNSKYTASRQICVDSALTLLRIQQTVDKESRAGNREYKLQTSSSTIMMHDFILAGTITALDLLGSVQAEAAGEESGDSEVWGADRQEEEMQALCTARDIFASHRGLFVEAFKAHAIGCVMIDKIRTYQQQIQSRQSKTFKISNTVYQTPTKDDYSQTLQSNMMQSGSGLMPNFPMDAGTPNNFPFFSNVDDMTIGMDWNSWDQFMLDPDVNAGLTGDVWPQAFSGSSGQNLAPGVMPNGVQDGTIYTGPLAGVQPGPTL